MYTMMENQTDQQFEHPANGYTAPLDLQKQNIEARSELECRVMQNDQQAQGQQSESPQNPQLGAESYPEASEHSRSESDAQPSAEQSGSGEASPEAKSSASITIPPAPRISVEEFLTELVHAYPHLDLTCLTTKDIQVMMRHGMTLNKEKFGLVPLAEYEATRRPKPVPRATTNYGNPYQNVKNSAAHQQMAYSNMQQNYSPQATSQSQVNASQSANPYANIDPAVLSNWYNEMLKTGYPQEQLQAYFSDMLVKMTQGQAAMQQQQQQQQQTPQQQQWASTVANTYAAASTAASSTAVYAASTSAQQQQSTSAAYSSQAASYNHKSASPYDAHRTTTPDSAAYDAQKLAALQQYANYQGSAAAAAALAAQQSTAYPQTALDMSTWQQQAQASGSADLSMQYGAQEDQPTSQQHQGYM